MRPRLQRGESDLSAGVSSPPSVALSSLHHLTSEGVEADFQDAVLNALRTLVEGQGRMERGIDLLKAQNGVATSVSLPSARESILTPSVIDRLRTAYSVDKAESPNSPRVTTGNFAGAGNLGPSSGTRDARDGLVGKSGSYPLRPFEHFFGQALAEEETPPPSSRPRFQTDAEKELPTTSHCQVHTREAPTTGPGLVASGISGATVGTVASSIPLSMTAGPNQNHVGASPSVASVLSMPSSASAFHHSSNLHYLLNSHNLHHSSANANANAGAAPGHSTGAGPPHNGFTTLGAGGAGAGIGVGVGGPGITMPTGASAASASTSRLRCPSLLAALESAGAMASAPNSTTWPLSVKLRTSRYDELKSSSWREALRLQDYTSEPTHQFKAWRAMDPNCFARLTLDVLSVFAMLFDLLLLPVLIAWDLPLEDPLPLVTKLLLCFWVVHLCSNFATGCFDSGSLLLDLGKVALHYVRTWFGFDCAMLICNVWAAYYGTKDDDSVYCRALPYVRAAGLLRILRLRQVLACLWERVFDDDILLVMDCLWTLSGLFLLGHLGGCLWFLVGSEAPSDTGQRWATSLQLQTTSGPTSDLSRAYEYFTAVNWALAHLTTGSAPVLATNTWERVITILAQIGGTAVLSLLVAAATARLAQHRSRRHLASTKVKRLSSILDKAQVPTTLVVAANKMAKERLMGRAKSCLEDVRGLEFLSLKLRAQLHFSICRRWLGHPLLEWWAATDPTSARSMCFCALNFILVRTGETLFAALSEASAAFTLANGCLIYTQDDRISKNGDCPKAVRVRQGTRLSEGALWCHWMHVGNAEAAAPGEVVAIDAQTFFESLSDSVSPTVFFKYASTFLSRMRTALPPLASQPNDLYVPFASCEEVLSTMPTSAREAVALTSMGHSLQSASSSSCSASSWSSPWSSPSTAASSWLASFFSPFASSSSPSSSPSSSSVRGEGGRSSSSSSSCRSAPLRKRLLEETLRGECALILGLNGLRRTECFIGLKLKRPDDRFFAEMGVLTETGVQATCCYPCKRSREGETPAQSLQRLLLGALLPLAQIAEVAPDSEHCLEHFGGDATSSGSIRTFRRGSCLTASICTVSATLALGKCPTIPLQSLPRPDASVGTSREDIQLYLLGEPVTAPPNIPPLQTLQVAAGADVKSPNRSSPASPEAARSDLLSKYRFRLFAWLTEEEFEELCLRRGLKRLQNALSTVNISNEQLDVAVENYQAESQPRQSETCPENAM